MTARASHVINIALVGGGAFCREVLEKTAQDFPKDQVNSRILVVADPDPDSPCARLAETFGIKTVRDYHELYRSEHRIELIIPLTPDEAVFEDLLRTKPDHIRLLSYPAFKMFWKAIRAEEDKLRQRTEEMETILNGIQDFILVFTPDREILEANEAFLRNMGYRREEVVGRKCHEIFRKEMGFCSFGTTDCPLTKCVRSKETLQEVRTRIDHEGALHYIEVTIFPIWEKEGRISRFIEVSRDITARKREEEEITRRLEQMVEDRTRQLSETHSKMLHQDKMASLGKLAASVVHEINNPIAGILNFIMLIKRTIQEGSVSREDLDRMVEYLSLMEEETRRVSRTVSHLLAFSRQTKLEAREVDLNRVIEKALILNTNLLKISNVRLVKDLAGDIPPLVASEDQMQQVFVNLLSNAVEAMESKGGGTLTVKTALRPEPPTVMVWVTDSGVGIPDENLSKLFEPFFTTKKKGKGVGLGLSVVYGIVQEHGGGIRVRSEKEKGTTFEIAFPVSGLRRPTASLGGKHVSD